MAGAIKKQKRVRSLPQGEFRTRCYDCYRPVESCFCDAIPEVDNRTDVLILQHQRERRHPFNTARIVNKALNRCRLIFDRNESFADRDLAIIDGAALLYPSKDARLVSELTPEEMPSQLIVIDGTWDHAKALFRDVPQLHDLPRLKLNPSSPGQYRIRREPTEVGRSQLVARHLNAHPSWFRTRRPSTRCVHGPSHPLALHHPVRRRPSTRRNPRIAATLRTRRFRDLDAVGVAADRTRSAAAFASETSRPGPRLAGLRSTESRDHPKPARACCKADDTEPEAALLD